MPSDPRVRAAMTTLTQTLKAPANLAQTLKVLTQGAVHAIPGASHASISVRNRKGELETLAPTDPVISDLDAHQYELQEGPCYATVASDDTMLVTFDLGSDPRWPRYGPLAAEAGFRAQLALLLNADDRYTRSSLNVYAADPHEFDGESVDVAEMFASHAAVAMGFVDTIDHLAVSIGSRQTIGQAVGITMERYQIDEERAFEFLVRVSRNSNVKLRTIAADMVSSHNQRTQRKPDWPRAVQAPTAL